MPKVFFTYVWGRPGNPAWPLTFGSKAARTQAKKALSEGDYVFTVGTKSEPTLPDHRGRVLALYQLTSLEVNTQDFVEPSRSDKLSDRAVTEFPYALYPHAVWEISEHVELFSKLVGPLTGAHHMQARTTVVELDTELGAKLMALARHELPLAEPITELGRTLFIQRSGKLGPKHEGDFKGSFSQHDVWYVYALSLRDHQGHDLAFKIGYASDPIARRDAYQTPLATEVTGLSWELSMKQATSSEDEARRIEQALLTEFAKHKLPSNGEIIRGTTLLKIMSTMATVLRTN